MKFKSGATIINPILKLYNSFNIFYSNHLLNKRSEVLKNYEFPNNETSISPDHFERFIYDDLANLIPNFNNYIELFGINEYIIKLIQCAYMPCLFKLYSGLMSLYIF